MNRKNISLGLFLGFSLGAAMAHAADFQIVSKALSTPSLTQSLAGLQNRDSYRFDSIKAEWGFQNSNKRPYEVRITHDANDVHDVMPDLCLTILINEETGAVELVDSKINPTKWLSCQGR